MYIRVISDLKRWKSIVNGNSELLLADCFSDIKTTHNTLSLWKVEDSSSQEDLENFTVVATLGRTSIDKVSYVCIEENEIEKHNLELKNDNPMCQYLNNEKSDFIKHHFDIINIDCDKYKTIAHLIRTKVNNDELKILTKNSVISAATRLLNNNILIKDNLSENVRNKITS